MMKKAPQIAHVYPIPARYLNDNLVEMLFWDAVFYLLAVRGETNQHNHRFTETTFKELTTLTGLSTRSLRKQLDVAMAQPEPRQLREEEGIIAYGRLLKFQQYDEMMAGEKLLLKPTAFMANGWGELLNRPYPGAKKSSRFPLTVLNRLLMKPNGRLTSRAELISRSRHPNPRKGKKPPDAAVIAQAIDHLLALGLIEAVGDDKFMARREQFNLPAAQIWAQMEGATSADYLPEAVHHAQKQDPARAELALQLAAMGNFGLDAHFKEIFYELSQFRLETDREWVEYVVKRHRGKPAGAKRWQRCVAAIERKLQQESALMHSVKCKLALRHAAPYKCELTLPPNSRRLRWGKLVVWYEDARYKRSGLSTEDEVEARLWLGDDLIWKRPLTYRDAVEHFDLTAVLRQHPDAVFRFVITAVSPLRHVTVSAMLEAQYIK